MATKEKKGAKFGRNTRSPSAKLQRFRSDANKAKRIKTAVKGSVGHICPPHPSKQEMPKMLISSGLVPEMRVFKTEYLGDPRLGNFTTLVRMPRLIIRDGVTVDVRA